MGSQSQVLDHRSDTLPGGLPITIPAFARRPGVVHHFFGTRPEAGASGGPSARTGVGDEDPLGEPEVEPESSLRDRSRVPESIISLKQVHGTDVLVLDRPVPPGEAFPGGWDAVVTDQIGLLLTIRTADCVPLLLYDPRRQVIAAIHAGWRGAVAGIVPKTIRVMQDQFGSLPSTLEIGIGPSVGPCCYEVDDPVLTRLREGFIEWRAVILQTSPTTAMLDLRGLVRRQAEQQGVRPDCIRAVRVCTVCHPTLFYSYRRERSVNGTMVSGIMLRPGRRQR